jgi:hypothetical protein
LWAHESGQVVRLEYTTGMGPVLEFCETLTNLYIIASSSECNKHPQQSIDR